MTYIYNENNYRAAKAKRDKLLIVYFSVAAAAVGLNVFFFIMRNTFPRGLMEFLNIVTCVLFGAWSLFFFAMQFSPIRHYYKLLKNYINGVSESYSGNFLRFEDEPHTKDGVIFYSLICEEKVVKRQDLPERRILIEMGLPKPQFEAGQRIKYITHAGVLVAYETARTKESI
ncbi:MAG: hypothetical protein LBS99_01870 [Clostridiales bacterium]|jgi:hypothetical protein|nr:hypothetical protein [Clostridiales bacterium]